MIIKNRSLRSQMEGRIRLRLRPFNRIVKVEKMRRERRGLDKARLMDSGPNPEIKRVSKSQLSTIISVKFKILWVQTLQVAFSNIIKPLVPTKMGFQAASCPYMIAPKITLCNSNKLILKRRSSKTQALARKFEEKEISLKS